MSLGIQVAFPSNVSAGAATTAPGRPSSGGTGAETFLSTYASSLSNSALEAARTSENTLSKGKTNAKTAAGVGGLTTRSNAATKEQASPPGPATGAASVTAPAAPQLLSSTLAPATLPDFSPAFAAAQDSQFAPGGGPAVTPTSATQTLTSQSSTTQSPLALGSTALVTGSTVSDDQADGDPAQTQSSVTAFAAPLQLGLNTSAGAPANPVQGTADTSAQNAAAAASSLVMIKSPAQNSGSEPASGAFADAIPGGVAPESGATPALLSSAANLQSRRESLAAAKQVASAEGSQVRLRDSDSANSPAVGRTTAHGFDSGSTPQNGLATESVFQMHLVPNSVSSVSSSSTAPALTTTGTPVAAASGGPDLSGKQMTASVHPDHSPSGISPANGAPGQDEDSGSSDSEARQSEGDQSFRKDLTTVGTQPAAAQPVMPQLTTTAVPGDAAGQLGTGPAASSAAKTDTATTPAAPDSQNPTSPGETPAAAVGPVQMAQMVSRAAQSEMHIGLTTSAFGNVEVHTQIRANDVGLVIGSERGDLRSLMANELPGLTNRLQEQSLRLSPVNFHESSAFSGGSQSGGDSQRRFFTPLAQASPSVAESETSPVSGTTTESPRSRHAGLSVLA